MEGVIDVFCANDLEDELPEIPLRLAPFTDFQRFLQKPLANKKVRYVGEPVAVVVAEDRYIAEDALELICLEVEPLPAIVTVQDSLKGETLIHDAAGENIGTQYSVSRGDVEAAFKGAFYTRQEHFGPTGMAPFRLKREA